MFPSNLIAKKTTPIQHINSIMHEGKVIAFATDPDGSIWYTIKQDGFENTSLASNSSAVPGWEDLQRLRLPDQAVDPSVLAKEAAECTYAGDRARYVMRSRYKTQGESAVAPVQLVSALGHIYVFRQSKANTLLVDRFVLDGMDNTLNPRLEVRYKRSRQKYSSASETATNNLDALDFCDAEGANFLEPTTELCLIDNLHDGWFSVVFVPTTEPDVYRWHIFAYDSVTKKVEVTTLRASEDGLFEIKDYTLFQQSNNAITAQAIPGIIKRAIDVDGFTVTNGLAATKYDLQVEGKTQSGETQLLKTAARILLAIPGQTAADVGTDDTQAVAFSFAIAADGTLSRIAETPALTNIRSTPREVVLPLNSLDDIKCFGSANAPLQGVITGFAVGTEDAVRDLVTVATQGAAELKNGDLVRIKGSQDYQGLYSTTKVDDHTFTIRVAAGQEMGFWEKQEAQSGSLIFDGQVIAYRKTTNDELTVTCRDHGLSTGDAVQISGTQSFNKTHTVKKIDDAHFAIACTWPIAEGVDVKRIWARRRGLGFDGQSAVVRITLDVPQTEATHELWFKTSDAGAGLFSVGAGKETARHLYLRGGNIAARICNDEVIASSGLNLADDRWHHVAHVFGQSVGGQRLYIDGELVASGPKSKSDFGSHDAVYVGYSADAANHKFRGQIAEVRIWKQTRSQTSIRNNRYLQLTGNELDLIGYWRMGAILDGTVLDFSPSKNAGVVSGNACISTTTLSRTLSSGQPVVIYGNEELVAVSQHNTYEESLEFKVNAAANLNPSNVDGHDTAIFSFSHWGKISRSAEERMVIASAQNAFEALDDGWYRASCRFTVPEDMNFVRCFELASIAGDWQSMEIRKHRVRLMSDSITQAQYVDKPSLTVLGSQQSNSLTEWRKAELQERLIPPLLKEYSELQAKISVYDASETSRNERDRLNATIPTLESDTSALQAQYESEKESPFNYRCIIASAYNGRVWTYGTKGGFSETFVDSPNGSLAQQWEFIPAGNGDYYIRNRGIYLHDLYCTYNYSHGSYPLVTADIQGGYEQQWRFQRSGGCYRIAAAQHLERYCRYIYQTTYSQVALFELDASGGASEPANNWQLQKTQVTTNQRIDDAYGAWQRKLKERDDAMERRRYLNSILSSTSADKEAWLARIQEVKNAISAAETKYNVANKTYIDEVRALNQTRQSMPPVAKDAQGLVTQGAVLGFVNPTSRLTALETCEGNVQLSYFDGQRRMRHTNYDVTADSRNNAYEEWVPDAQRVCVDFCRQASHLALVKPLALPASWTLEAWFCYPFPKSARALNSLTRGETGGHQVMIAQGKELGMYFKDPVCGKHFYDCGFDLETLNPGWHHLAVVSKGDTARFYIDGAEVGDIKTKAKREAKAAVDKDPNSGAAKDHEKAIASAELTFSGDIAFIGGHAASGDLRFGKLAEVRIWGIALTPEEVAVNSCTTLSGNEPGLLAYYPMNEAAGAEVRDATGNGNTTEVSNADWAVCTAPMGRTKHEFFQFEGGDDRISLSPKKFPIGNAMTVSFWAKGGAELPNQNSVLFGADAKGNRVLNIHLPWTDNQIYFDCGVDDAGAYDRISKGTAASEFKGSWVHWAFTKDAGSGVMAIYKNGVLWASGTGMKRPLTAATTLVLGARYHGQIFDLRISNVAQSQDEIKAGIVPPVLDALLCNEYSTVIIDPRTKQKVAMMRRFHAYPSNGGIAILPDKRIEALVLKWVGNAQFEPTLLGFIEGAPPIPSENLTEQYDYNGATSVALTKSEDVVYGWNRAQDIGGGADANFFAGIEFDADAGGSLGATYIQKVGALRVGATGDLSTSGFQRTETSIASSINTSVTDTLVLRGTPERTPKFPHLGKRFIPKNVGYAVVVSALADVFVTCLVRSRKMVGYHVRPVENIPPDVNTITFMMNPAHVMSGSLDGMTGSRPTSERFFRNVPEMRAQYGSHYPASYYRLQDSYALKAKIEAADKRREAYFASYNAGLVDETSLKATTGVDMPTSLGNAQTTTKKTLSGAEGAAAQKQKEIDERIKDVEKRAHASSGFAGWQRRMENIQILAGKHNIVNNYVWDADGGLRAEAQNFANTIEHTIGGSLSFSFGIGAEVRAFVVVASAELQARASFSLTQTMSKTLSTTTGVSLDVNLDGVEYKGITNHDDHPIQSGEKVSRYRFMSFYLEGDTTHYNDFFSQVVDPEWLASNSEEARALRKVRSGKPNKAWRVLHRVTYVERPTLSNFGQDVRSVTPAALTSDTKELLNRVAQLEQKNNSLDMKLDKILELLMKSNPSG